MLFGLPNNGDNSVTLNKKRIFRDNDMQFGAIKNMLSVKLEIEKNILSREKPYNFAKLELLYNKLNI